MNAIILTLTIVLFGMTLLLVWKTVKDERRRAVEQKKFLEQLRKLGELINCL